MPRFARRSQIYSSIKELPWPLNSRQFVNEFVWVKQEDSSFACAFRPVVDGRFDDNRLVDTRNKKLVRGESRGFIHLKNVGERRCELTYIQHTNGNGNIPGRAMTKALPRSLHVVFQTNKLFNRDDEIDREDRRKLMAIMKDDENPGGYSDEENAMVNRVLEKVESAKDDDFVSLISNNFQTKMSISHTKGETNAFLKCEVTVDASVEECAAYK